MMGVTQAVSFRDKSSSKRMVVVPNVAKDDVFIKVKRIVVKHAFMDACTRSAAAAVGGEKICASAAIKHTHRGFARRCVLSMRHD